MIAYSGATVRDLAHYVFRTTRTVALDIGCERIKAVELSFGPASIQLVACGEIATPAETVEEGQVRDPYAMGYAIRSLLEAENIAASRAAVTTYDPSTRWLFTTWRAMPEAELACAVEGQLFSVAGGNPTDYVASVRVLGPCAGAERAYVAAAAVRRSVVDGLAQAVEIAGLVPAHLEPRPLSLVSGAGVGEDSAILVGLGGSGVEWAAVNAGRVVAVDHSPLSADTEMSDDVRLEEIVDICREKLAAAERDEWARRRVLLSGDGVNLDALRLRLSADVNREIVILNPLLTLLQAPLGPRINRDYLATRGPRYTAALGVALRAGGHRQTSRQGANDAADG